MVKGLSRRVIVVDSPDPHIFEQAIFIVRNDAAVGSGGVTSQQVVDQAIRIAKDYARTHGAPPRRRLRMSPWLAALLGARPSARCGCWPCCCNTAFFLPFFSSLEGGQIICPPSLFARVAGGGTVGRHGPRPTSVLSVDLS